MGNALFHRWFSQMSRELSVAFSTRTLRELSRARPAPWAYERAATVAAVVADDAPLRAAFDAAYEQLVDDYRCEYVYKNMVIEHCLEADPNANAMTGLPVFLSIADVVVAGNSASAFEVKTDLDSFTRLELQLCSYSRCFEFVYVVVSSSRASARNSQILWIGGRQATSDTGVSGEGSGVMSTGRSRSLPLWNSAPARTSATSCGALTARHRDCAASISL